MDFARILFINISTLEKIHEPELTVLQIYKGAARDIYYCLVVGNVHPTLSQ